MEIAKTLAKRLKAMVAPYAKSKARSPRLYPNKVILSEYIPGPPPVKIYILSTILKISMDLSKMAAIDAGISKGNIISLNSHQLEAPSTLAASSRAGGMP